MTWYILTPLQIHTLPVGVMYYQHVLEVSSTLLQPQMSLCACAQPPADMKHLRAVFLDTGSGALSFVLQHAKLVGLRNEQQNKWLYPSLFPRPRLCLARHETPTYFLAG
jgi:hypothetical protein